jgi:hypothetical protein
MISNLSLQPHLAGAEPSLPCRKSAVLTDVNVNSLPSSSRRQHPVGSRSTLPFVLQVFESPLESPGVMSRLTSRAPFNRPTAFDVLTPPRPAPLSPPETEMEPGPAPPQDDNDSVSPENQQGRTDSPPVTRFRTVAYKSSSLSREPRPTQRQSRWLVMVVPPTSLTREPPLLGHTLSSAPAGRFSNGILMPLFPTVSAGVFVVSSVLTFISFTDNSPPLRESLICPVQQAFASISRSRMAVPR